jgi:hypothetical protein
VPPTTSSLPAAAQAAGNKCFNILMDFNNAQFVGSMAGIETMNNDISNDVFYDATIKNATKAWSACMARNGFSAADPNTLALNELDHSGPAGNRPSRSNNPDRRAEGGADRAGRGRCQLHSQHGLGRHLLRRPRPAMSSSSSTPTSRHSMSRSVSLSLDPPTEFG